MIAYGLGILPLIWDLRKDHPGVTQPGYDYDAGVGGTFDGIHKHLENLMMREPPRGYFLEPTKRILVVSQRNVPRVEVFFCWHGLKIGTGNRYTKGISGDRGGVGSVVRG